MLPEVTYWARIKGAGYHAYLLAGEQPLDCSATGAVGGVARRPIPAPGWRASDGIGAVISDGRLEAVLALGESA